MSWKRALNHGRDPGLPEVDSCQSADRWRDHHRALKLRTSLISAMKRNALLFAVTICLLITVTFMAVHDTRIPHAKITATATISTIVQRSVQDFDAAQIGLAWQVIMNASSLRDQSSGATSSQKKPMRDAIYGSHSLVLRERLSLAESRAFLELFLTQILPTSQSYGVSNTDGVSNMWTSGSPYLLPHELQKAEAKNMMGLLHQLWVVHTQKSSPSRMKDSGTAKCLESSLLHQFAHAAMRLTAASCGQSGWIWSAEGNGLTYVLLRRLSVAMLHLLHGEVDMSGNPSERRQAACSSVLNEVRLLLCRYVMS